MHDYSPGEIRRVLRNAGRVMRNAGEVVERRGMNACRNYLRTVALTTEDGASVLNPFYARLPVLRLPYPVRIEVETTTRCFFKCGKCEQTYWDEPQQNMSLEQFACILDQFPDLCAVSMSGIGHNFQNPAFIDMVEEACGRDLYVQFFDTYYFTNEEKARRIVDAGVAKLNMSIDGADKQTYETLQLGSDFERVVENAARLARIKKEARSNFPEQAFTVVVTRFNQHQLPRFVDLIRDIVAGSQRHTYIEFIPLVVFKENTWLQADLSRLADEQREVAAYTAKMRDVRIRWFHVSGEVYREPVSCCLGFLVPFILVDGTVYPCCVLTEGNQRRFVKPHALGNVFERPFREIWDSPRYRNFRKVLRMGRAPFLCHVVRECPAFRTEDRRTRAKEKAS